MGLKNYGNFIGIFVGRGQIELRDYDDIADLPDGTEILIFQPHTGEIDEIKALIEKLEALETEIGEEIRDGVRGYELLRRVEDRSSLKDLGRIRRAQITRCDGKSEILFRKGRLRVIKKDRTHQKVPMTPKY
jgi:hypothetical protein